MLATPIKIATMAALGRGLLARAGAGPLAAVRRFTQQPRLTCPSLTARAKCACGSCACEAGHGLRRSHRERFAEAWAVGKVFSVFGLYIFLEDMSRGGHVSHRASKWLRGGHDSGKDIGSPESSRDSQ